MSTEAKLQVPLKGAGGEDKGFLTLDGARIDSRLRYPLLKEAVVMYAARKRVGTHSTKTRGQVSGSGKKPWKQKGTGRARAGTKKSPLWVGGGIVFGPHPRDYYYSINRKQRRVAMRSALLSKFRDGQVVVVEGWKTEGVKTKPVARTLESVGVRGSCLIATAACDRALVLSARNLPGVLVSPLSDLNALDLLRVKSLVLTREAYDLLETSLEAAEASDVASEAEAETK